jgi:hypothetical protein
MTIHADFKYIEVDDMSKDSHTNRVSIRFAQKDKNILTTLEDKLGTRSVSGTIQYVLKNVISIFDLLGDTGRKLFAYSSKYTRWVEFDVTTPSKSEGVLLKPEKLEFSLKQLRELSKLMVILQLHNRSEVVRHLLRVYFNLYRCSTEADAQFYIKWKQKEYEINIYNVQTSSLFNPNRNISTIEEVLESSDDGSSNIHQMTIKNLISNNRGNRYNQ